MRVASAKIAFLLVVFTAFASTQTAVPNFPPEVLERKASVVGVQTTPRGGIVKVDGTIVPTLPFILIKKDKPRVLKFELAGYRSVEQVVEPGNHYVIGIGVDFIHHKAGLFEGDQPPGTTATPKVNEPVTADSLPPAEETAPPAAQTASAPSTRPAATPFGFATGMTKQQVIAKLGKAAVMTDSGVAVTFNTAPNPHPDFEVYACSFSPEKGLLKVVAISRDIRTSDDGSELQSKFHSVRDALADKYGKPEKDFDFCKANDVECRSEYYMMELKEQNRYLSSYWQAASGKLPLNIHTIAVEANALGINKGYISVGYEFAGWEEFADELKHKRDSSF
jgi:hypothetical protein